MPFKSPIKIDVEFTVKLRPVNGIINEVMTDVAVGFIQFAQEVVADAVRISKQKGVWDTGNNARSIGYAISLINRISFDNLITSGNGTTGSEGVPGSRKDKLELLIATSSGYGGFNEVGTRKLAARPYITPAVIQNRQFLEKALEGIIK